MKHLQQVEGNAITRSDAARFNHDVIGNWEPQLEVWPFSVGDTGLSLLACLSAFHTTHFLRKMLKIRPYGRLTCYSPVMGLAGIATHLFHSYHATRRVMERGSCPQCTALYSGAGQLAFGSLYPLLMAPVICFYMADKLMSYPIPPLVRAPKEMLRLYLGLLAKSPRPFFAYAAVNVVAAFAIGLQKERIYGDLLYRA